jgi:hypothetical protein
MATLAKNPKNALLPPDFVEPTLREARIGQTFYVVPWAMTVDHEYRCWLSLTHTPHDAPGGTVQMRVQLQEDGWHVWLARDYRYRLAATPVDLTPVVGLHQ